MYEWRRQIQQIVDEIDGCIRSHDDAALTLRSLSRTLGYSEYYTTRKFREISGMQLRDYLRRRRLAFALREVRDSERSLLGIALDYGFSSHEAFTRAFKDAYGVTPSAYRAAPRPVVLRTKIHPFDRYFLGLGEIGMATSKDGVKTYFVTIPAHKFLHIENRESNGYWDFWQKQALIPGQDCETICGLLESIRGKLDDDGGEYAGQVMGYLNDATAVCATGAICARSATVRGFPPTTAVRCPRRCSSRTFPRGNTSSLSTARSTTSRSAARWRRRSRRRCAASTTPPRAAPSTRRRPGASPTSTSIPGSISSTSAR